MTTPRIWLIRHGETQWSRAGRHTGLTDVPLTDQGRADAQALRGQVARLDPGLVLCSPLARARETARLAGLNADQVTDDLREWDYGAWEGRTTAEIRVDLRDPTWLVWDHPVPPGRTPGEQLGDVGARADRVLTACAQTLEQGRDCVLVSHAHVLRILTARWLDQPPVLGRLFALAPAHLAALGYEHGQPVITAWNLPPDPS